MARCGLPIEHRTGRELERPHVPYDTSSLSQVHAGPLEVMAFLEAMYSNRVDPMVGSGNRNFLQKKGERMKKLIQMIIVTAMVVMFVPSSVLAENTDPKSKSTLQDKLDACAYGMQTDKASEVESALASCKKARAGIDVWTSELMASDKAFGDVHKPLAKLQRIRGKVARTQVRLENRLSETDNEAKAEVKEEADTNDSADTKQSPKPTQTKADTPKASSSSDDEAGDESAKQPLQAVSNLSGRVDQLEYDVDRIRKNMRDVQKKTAIQRKRVGKLNRTVAKTQERLVAVEQRNVVTQEQLSERLASIQDGLKNAESDTDFKRLKGDLKALSEDLVTYKKQMNAYKRQMDERFVSIETELQKFDQPKVDESDLSDEELNARIDARIEGKLPDLAKLRTDLETLRSQHKKRLDQMDKTIKDMRVDMNDIILALHKLIRESGPPEDGQQKR